MDFNYRKPTHLFALFLMILSVIIIFGLPILSFIDVVPSTQDVEYEKLKTVLLKKGQVLTLDNLIK